MHSSPFISAPSSVSMLSQFGGTSSWGVTRLGAGWVAHMLNHTPDQWANYGRTPGRALRAIRRASKRLPVSL
jgi:hypothetical protein